MAYKYQTFADLLYASYSGLQTLAFAFGKGKNRCDKDCYAFRQSVIRKLKAGEMKIGDLYQNIVRQMTSPHGELSGMDLSFDFRYLPLSYPQPEDANESLSIRNFQLQRLESKEDICRIGHGRTNL